jgi:adenosylhomocysteine nucleosidase
MVLIIGALAEEIDEIARACAGLEEHVHHFWRYTTGTLAGKTVAVVKSGVGKVLAAACTQSLIEHLSPNTLINIGIAGSLKQGIARGDTLVATDCVQHDLNAIGIGIPRGQIPYTEQRFIACDPNLVSLAARYQPASGKIHLGRLCSGDQFIDAEERQNRPYLTGELDGAAVEMEAAAIGLIATLFQVSFLSYRTISDSADEAAHDHYEAFLPQASANNLAMLNYLLSKLP